MNPTLEPDAYKWNRCGDFTCELNRALTAEARNLRLQFDEVAPGFAFETRLTQQISGMEDRQSRDRRRQIGRRVLEPSSAQPRDAVIETKQALRGRTAHQHQYFWSHQFYVAR